MSEVTHDAQADNGGELPRLDVPEGDDPRKHMPPVEWDGESGETIWVRPGPQNPYLYALRHPIKVGRGWLVYRRLRGRR